MSIRVIKGYDGARAHVNRLRKSGDVSLPGRVAAVDPEKGPAGPGNGVGPDHDHDCRHRRILPGAGIGCSDGAVSFTKVLKSFFAPAACAALNTSWGDSPPLASPPTAGVSQRPSSEIMKIRVHRLIHW